MALLPPGLKKPSARQFRTQRITGQVHHLAPPKTFRPNASVTDDFLSSKRDKRLMKHSAFKSRIESSGVKKSKKRTGRNRSRKLTTMESLADALPELESGEGGAEVLQGKIKRQSLKSKKGALKKKEQVVRGEMERFGVSMAKLSEQPATTTTTTANNTATTENQPVSNRWAALRGYISATMEQNPAFNKE